MLRLDVSDFFMSGEHPDILDSASQLVDANRRLLFREALALLLETQFLQASTVSSSVAQVTQGSGMGLVHSGETADAAVLTQAELPYGLNPRIVAHYKVKLYVRYKDDIFIVLGACPVDAYEYAINLSNSSRSYTVELEEMSMTPVRMLDMEFFKGPGWRASGVLDSRVVFKASSLGVPLATHSGHTVGCHWWPVSECRRLGNLCSSLPLFVGSRDLLERRLVQFNAPKFLVDLVRRSFPGLRSLDSGGRTLEDRKATLWLCLPFHPVWQRAGLTSAVEQFFNGPLSRRLLQDAFNARELPWASLRVSWGNALPDLVARLRPSAVEAKPLGWQRLESQYR